ncbi:PDZ domain-containing protein [Dyella silvae]|uniref:PDZ domain-containing protein n=1 Tax=Dyella silvae TaxID=2994424 RepID=UPI0022655ABD|nr:PDZ domain-containing protein [Dyella silvae]
MKWLLVIAAALCMAGCTNGYEKFYRPNPAASSAVVAAHRASPPPAQPILDHTGLVGDALVKAYGAQGYVVLGYSSFNAGGSQSDAGALAQGRAVGADLVVIANPAYTGTQSAVIPVVTPTSSTSYSSGTATAYGTGGSATAFDNSTTTTYGTQTNYIPMHVDRYDFLAVYLVKFKVRLGAQVVDLSPEQRQELQSNHGVAVVGVVNGSPAFDADILVGDLIITMDGRPIGGSADYAALLDQKAGRRVALTINRHGSIFAKEVTLNP